MNSEVSSRAGSGTTCMAGLLAKRVMIVPTWRGWLLLMVVAAAILIPTFRGAYDFLAPYDPVPGGILVVEGYATDDMLQEGIAEFGRHHYERLFVTGGPIERGEPLFEYKTLPDAAVATMEKMGMARSLMQAVPSVNAVRDRTYASAVALKEWLRAHGMTVKKINLLSAGLHSRRSRLMFQEALGPGVEVGVIPFKDIPADLPWWKSSAGVRGVIDEGLAFIYARFFFSKPD